MPGILTITILLDKVLILFIHLSLIKCLKTSSLIFWNLTLLHINGAPAILTSSLIDDLDTTLVVYSLDTHLWAVAETRFLNGCDIVSFSLKAFLVFDYFIDDGFIIQPLEVTRKVAVAFDWLKSNNWMTLSFLQYLLRSVMILRVDFAVNRQALSFG